MIKRGRSGQATIFIIIALIIVAVVMAIFIYPKIRGGGKIDATQNPQTYLESCLKAPLENSIKKLGATGGDTTDSAFIMFNGTKVRYLCYTSEYYKTCVIQEPLVKEKFEQSIAKAINADTEKCVNNLVNEYEKQGWKSSVSAVSSDVNIDLDSVKIIINAPMTLTKDVSKTYNTFSVSIPSKIYEVLYLSSNIVQFEAAYGDSETTLYLLYYPNINIYKNVLGDGSVIYRVENDITKEKFTFASRSLVSNPGL